MNCDPVKANVTLPPPKVVNLTVTRPARGGLNLKVVKCGPPLPAANDTAIWPVIITADFVAEWGYTYQVDPAAGDVVMTMPAVAGNEGKRIGIFDVTAVAGEHRVICDFTLPKLLGEASQYRIRDNTTGNSVVFRAASVLVGCYVESGNRAT
jgi:hypothetical protein